MGKTFCRTRVLGLGLGLVMQPVMTCLEVWVGPRTILRTVDSFPQLPA
jgi:hypothetical protein